MKAVNAFALGEVLCKWPHYMSYKEVLQAIRREEWFNPEEEYADLDDSRIEVADEFEDLSPAELITVIHRLKKRAIRLVKECGGKP